MSFGLLTAFVVIDLVEVVLVIVGYRVGHRRGEEAAHEEWRKRLKVGEW